MKRLPCPSSPDHNLYTKYSSAQGSVFYNCNIFTLKHLIDTSSSPSELRSKLLSYTRLAQPFCTDIFIKHNFLTSEEIQEDLSQRCQKSKETEVDSQNKMRFNIHEDLIIQGDQKHEIASKKNSLREDQSYFDEETHAHSSPFSRKKANLNFNKEEGQSNCSKENNEESENDLNDKLTVLLQRKNKEVLSTNLFNPHLDRKPNDPQCQLSAAQTPIILSNEQYASILLQMLEVLGVSIVERVNKTWNELEVSGETNLKLSLLTYEKTYMFSQMIKRFFEGEEVPVGNEIAHQYFQSKYDYTIESVYQIYKTIISSKQKNEIEPFLREISSVINSTLAEEEKASSLSFLEKKNLIDLKEKLNNSIDFFSEKFKPINERSIFFNNEIVEINEENIDDIQFMQLTHYEYFDSRYTFFLLISLCSMANSKGGILFLGIHNIYSRVRGISLKEINSHGLIGEIRKLSGCLSPPLNFELKILPIEHSIQKDLNSQNFIIKIIINPRKIGIVYYYNRDIKMRFAFIKDRGHNHRLSDEQANNLQTIRSLENDIPNLKDYQGFSIDLPEVRNISAARTFTPSPSRSNSLRGRRANEFQNSEKREDGDIQHLKTNHSSMQSARMRPSYYSNDSLREKFHYQDREQKKENMFLSQYKNKDKIIERILASSEGKLLNEWKKQVLRNNLSGSSIPSYPEFKMNNPLNKSSQEMNNISLKQCYMVYGIDKSLLFEFQEQVEYALKNSKVEDFEFLGTFSSISVIRIDRERYSQAIQSSVLPLVINSSIRNMVVQGFTFDNFEIKGSQSLNQVSFLLEIIYRSLELPHTIQFQNNKLHIKFSRLLEFLYGYSIAIKLKDMFESLENIKRVKFYFNTLPKKFN